MHVFLSKNKLWSFTLALNLVEVILKVWRHIYILKMCNMSEPNYRCTYHPQSHD